MSLRIYCTYDEIANLYKSSLSAERLNLSELTIGDRVPVEFGLLKRTAQRYAINGGSSWEQVAAAGYSLAIGIYKASDRAQLTYLSTFTDVDSVLKSGTLLLDTAAISTALSTGTEIAAVLEIQITESGGNKLTVYRNTQFTLRKNYTTASLIQDIPSDVAATQNWVKSTCVPRDGTDPNNPCREVYMLNSDGNPCVLRIDSNYQISVERYA